jgi:hypothetical protein
MLGQQRQRRPPRCLRNRGETDTRAGSPHVDIWVFQEKRGRGGRLGTSLSRSDHAREMKRGSGFRMDIQVTCRFHKTNLECGVQSVPMAGRRHNQATTKWPQTLCKQRNGEWLGSAGILPSPPGTESVRSVFVRKLAAIPQPADLQQRQVAIAMTPSHEAAVTQIAAAVRAFFARREPFRVFHG